MTDITCYESVSAVIFNNITVGKGFISEVLTAVASAGINVDMISQTLQKSDKISFGFSFSDDDIPSLLKVMGKITAVHNVTPFVNSGNVKLVIKSSDMTTQAGFAANVFEKADKVGAEILLVTTGIDEISLLVSESDSDKLEAELNSL